AMGHVPRPTPRNLPYTSAQKGSCFHAIWKTIRKIGSKRLATRTGTSAPIVRCRQGLYSLLCRVLMTSGQKTLYAATGQPQPAPPPEHLGLYLTLGTAIITLLAALALPKGYVLAFIGDNLQTVLQIAAAFLAFRNALRARSQFRLFWLLMLLGVLMWLISQLIWCTYELWFRVPMPDSPVGDTLLFLKLVPFVAAAALEPDKT